MPQAMKSLANPGTYRHWPLYTVQHRIDGICLYANASAAPLLYLADTEWRWGKDQNCHVDAAERRLSKRNERCL